MKRMRELSAADFLYMTCRHICKMTDLLLPSLFVVVPLNGTIANPKASGAQTCMVILKCIQVARGTDSRGRTKKKEILYYIYIYYIYYIFNIYIYIFNIYIYRDQQIYRQTDKQTDRQTERQID